MTKLESYLIYCYNTLYKFRNLKIEYSGYKYGGFVYANGDEREIVYFNKYGEAICKLLFVKNKGYVLNSIPFDKNRSFVAMDTVAIFRTMDDFKSTIELKSVGRIYGKVRKISI